MAKLMAEVFEGETGYRPSKKAVSELAEAIYEMWKLEDRIVGDWYGLGGLGHELARESLTAEDERL